MNKLIGDAEEEDDLFWGDAHGTWEDDDENDTKLSYFDSGQPPPPPVCPPCAVH
jgi:hypothetical protein